MRYEAAAGAHQTTNSADSGAICLLGWRAVPAAVAAALDHDGFESGSDSKPAWYEAAAGAHQTTNSAGQRRYLFTQLAGSAR